MSQSYNFSSYSLTTEIVPSNLTQTRFFLGTQNEDSVTVSTDPLSLNNFNTLSDYRRSHSCPAVDCAGRFEPGA